MFDRFDLRFLTFFSHVLTYSIPIDTNPTQDFSSFNDVSNYKIIFVFIVVSFSFISLILKEQTVIRSKMLKDKVKFCVKHINDVIK